MPSAELDKINCTTLRYFISMKMIKQCRPSVAKAICEADFTKTFR